MKKIISAIQKVCKICLIPKDEKEFRGTQKICNTCDNARKTEYSRNKRQEARKFLGF